MSMAIPLEQSITPVLQDFMNLNIFYLPVYYCGGEELMVIRSLLVRVLHGLDKVLEGGAVVMTLRDHNIPSNGDINETYVLVG
ncbi:hypothetical protein ZEAMMB73_Zm00001d019189 [Zea mays]|uniref:Uncharacterized protein n=1 Tax=Zea mays TaxID=4577 RepID=A0A1D6HW34_MAIZE|nr:hypothetical protein ZEAMMB73_Zm00001d019189 [Zea mays]